MNNNNNNTTRTGLGFLYILTLIFVVAKILGFLTWPWYLVLLPAFIPLILLIIAIPIAWLWLKFHD